MKYYAQHFEHETSGFHGDELEFRILFYSFLAYESQGFIT